MTTHITDTYRGYPQFMSLNNTEAKVVSFTEIAVGDQLTDMKGTYSATITKIVEKRKAKGEYKEDERPDFYHIEIKS